MPGWAPLSLCKVTQKNNIIFDRIEADFGVYHRASGIPYIVLCQVSTLLRHYIVGKIQDDCHFCKVKQSIDIIFDKIYHF